MVLWNDTAMPTSVVVRERRPVWLLRRQLADKLHRPLHPALQLVVALDTFQADHDPALHRAPARDLELADVGLLQRLVALLRAEPDEQRVLPDADEQVPVEQEADPAEHPLLLDVLAPGQQMPDAPGQGFVKGHRRL